MDIEDVVIKLKDLSNEIHIEVKEFSSGYWVNQYNNEWITTRIYVSIKESSKLPNGYLSKIVNRVNLKSIKSNIEIIEK